MLCLSVHPIYPSIYLNLLYLNQSEWKSPLLSHTYQDQPPIRHLLGLDLEQDQVLNLYQDQDQDRDQSQEASSVPLFGALVAGEFSTLVAV
jgi:hypothetical protein